MKRLTAVSMAVAMFALTGIALAADKPDPNGTWKFTQMGRGGNSRDVTLKLKLDGDKLTGKITAGQDNAEVDIEEAKYKDGELSFQVTRERNGNKRVTKYKGKVDGDKITGKIDAPNQDGQSQERDWEAKREKKA